MISTFRETIISLRDPKYPEVIVKKTIPQSIWYWLKYLLFFTLIPLIFLTFSLTYYTPQLPRIIQEHFPEFSLTVSQGQASVVPNEPYKFATPESIFIIDTTTGSAQSLADYTSGFVISRDRLYVKSPDGNLSDLPLSELGDFSYNREELSAWISRRLFAVWLAALAGLLFFAFVAVLSYTLFNFALIFLWSVILALLGRISHRSLSFAACLKVSVHAAVLPLVISAVTFLGSSALITLLNIALFVFYSLSWSKSLTRPAK
ncbi:hypothetical protein A3D85_03310 [Candidatus Amesbacteria bacterium RIFCSPHIGHO2_02_FULL_47_9]|uniref:DUF1189 domain-containing protein n=1 Tax=Candidatus Amesbacteria bacterium RIFCSPHIGHO2_01_FULL_48_32b TaxID=1797253 RepID=A0A1F4YG84_9BACT|nr:MAG: hypothetical protein A2876_00355 [Candidatus Amesbacteria bacterium RIFCSPHIGHO2_01_FULL_48_32b]OGD04174.1 MAG: hypothetical protein A3D85_03310 [Candidatus Amesbacteria bacterium RIFCSPHIGHO2_02_FULL_47_9]OGD07528.1 MAG: hypothetical protein A2899_04480 [Candidatus Amesbacteria bacterium RIFCSPLOWO2_01_FULL_49_25]